MCKISTPSQQLADELHKPIVKKLNKRKAYSSFKYNICVVDLVDMQLLSTFNKGIRFLLCVINIFNKYAWVFPLKDKKGVTVVNASHKILDDSMKLHSKRKPNNIWVNNGSEFLH